MLKTIISRASPPYAREKRSLLETAMKIIYPFAITFRSFFVMLPTDIITFYKPEEDKKAFQE